MAKQESSYEQKDVIQVENLVKRFPVGGGWFSKTNEYVHAVSDVSFYLKKGETLGLVGESGCGKSTLGYLTLKMLEVDEGSIYFDGEDITNLKGEKLRRLRSQMQIVFQDPFASLNPRMCVGDIVGEPILVHNLCTKFERENRVKELLEVVGLKVKDINKYPHEFSGGQRQRIGIARAISVMPKFIVADEPVSALDVSIQGGIINLLQDLQKEFGISYLFISHDIKVVEHISHRIAVMYLGKIVETFDSRDISKAVHPYTLALLSAVPVPDPVKKKTRLILSGDVPSPIHPPDGCPFHPRCRYKEEICTHTHPIMEKRGDDHCVACHFIDKVLQDIG
ncbi:ATP-binding cassette domain-containing protein [bacterium]|nr:ATP-binding cassette domain-containing protein [bacterium]